MPATAAELSLKRGMEYDPEANIAAGIKYLGRLQNLFGGNLVSTLAAYNAGPGHHGMPQPGENTDYVARVLGNLRLGDTAATPTPEGPSPSIEDVRAQALDKVLHDIAEAQRKVHEQAQYMPKDWDAAAAE